MKISILCSNPLHPVNAYIAAWVQRHKDKHEVELAQKVANLKGGKILFLISCTEIVTATDRSRYDVCLILHASDLPQGRGWSPHVWQIAAGASFLTLSLLEAEDKVDSGRIWKKIQISIPSTALWEEINHLLFTAELQLMDFAVESFENIQPIEQVSNLPATYYRLRSKQDSKLDPHRSIAEQFDLIRVCDPFRFPAFFEYRGERFVLKIEKYKNE